MGKIDYDVLYDMIHSDDPDIAQQGRDELMESLYGFINYVIAQYYPTYYKIDREALFNEGAIGIMENIERFDPNKGNPLQYFKYCIIHNCSIYVDSFYHESTSYYRKKIDKVLDGVEYFNSMGIKYSMEDLAKHCGLSEKAVVEALAMHSRQSSKSSELYEVTKDKRKSPLDEVIEGDTKKALEDALTGLNEVERRLIILRFYDDMSYKDISAKVHSTSRKVQTDIQKILRKLRKNQDLVKAVQPGKKASKNKGTIRLSDILS